MRSTTSPSSAPYDQTRSRFPAQSPSELKVPDRQSFRLTPDRITRHAQVNQKVVHTPEEIVSRIPQPYRTSFSAVTAPRRFQSPERSQHNSDLSPQPMLSSRRNNSQFSSLRSKSASDSNVLDSDYSSSQEQIKSPYFYGSNLIKMSSKSSLNTSDEWKNSSKFTDRHDRRGSEDILTEKSKTKTQQLQQRLELIKSRTQHVQDDMTCVSEYKPSENAIDSSMLDVSKTCYITEQEFSSCVDSPEISDFTSDFNSSSYDKLYYADQSLIKDVIEKQYVHVQNVDYYSCVDKELQDDNTETTDKLVQDVIQAKEKAELSKRSPNDNQDPSTNPNPIGTPPRPSGKGRKSASGSPATSRRKSISTSITNFFIRMSPKALRKSPNNDKKKGEGHSSTPSVCSSSRTSVSSDTSDCSSASRSRSNKSPKVLAVKNLFNDQNSPNENSARSVGSRPRKSSSEEILDRSDHSGNLSPETMPSSSSRILKSLHSKNGTLTDKSVYQTFKDKHSPFRETNTNKTQALRATPLSNQRNAVGSSSPTEREKKDEVVSSRVPPKSLDVREVSKLAKNFQPYSFSAESIGQCSLDAFASKVGSEPSLISTNGNRSTSESKRTLHGSHDVPVPSGMSDTHNNSVDIPSKQHCKSDSMLDRPDHCESLWGHQRETPSTPSYVRISCSVSGYTNKYSSITPDRDSPRLRVIKRSPPSSVKHGATSVDETDATTTLIQNGSSQQMNGYVPGGNGHLNTDPLSPQILDSEVIVHSSLTELSQSKSGEKRYLTSVNVRPSSISASLSSCSLSSNELESREEIVNKDANIKTNDQSHRPHTGLQDVTNSEHESLKLDLSSLADENDVKVAVETSEKEGVRFLSVVQRTEDHLNACCKKVEEDLADDSLSEEVLGKLRAAIGKANLLTTKKFKQFRALCTQNIEQTGEEPFCTTGQDLEGFWDMVLIQVHDVNSLFTEIEQMKANGWKEVSESSSATSTSSAGRAEKSHTRQSSSGSVNIQLTPRSMSSAAKSKSPRSKETSSDSAGQSDRASKAKEAARIRDEARKRLMAAKRAGRKRVASQSDNTEIEIYAPE